MLVTSIFSISHNVFILPNTNSNFYAPAKQMFFECLSIRVSVRPCICLFTKYYFLSKCWQGYQVTLSGSCSSLKFILSSANTFSLDQSKKLSFYKEAMHGKILIYFGSLENISKLITGQQTFTIIQIYCKWEKIPEIS